MAESRYLQKVTLEALWEHTTRTSHQENFSGDGVESLDVQANTYGTLVVIRDNAAHGVLMNINGDTPATGNSVKVDNVGTVSPIPNVRLDLVRLSGVSTLSSYSVIYTINNVAPVVS